jgi:hypothetical protein
MSLLADAADPTVVQSQTFFWSSIIMAVALVGFTAIMIFKRLWKRTESASMDTGFSLSDLRGMRDRGEITPEEYEQTRARVIAKAQQRAPQPPPKPKPDAGENPTDLA